MNELHKCGKRPTWEQDFLGYESSSEEEQPFSTEQLCIVCIPLATTFVKPEVELFVECLNPRREKGHWGKFLVGKQLPPQSPSPMVLGVVASGTEQRKALYKTMLRKRTNDRFQQYSLFVNR